MAFSGWTAGLIAPDMRVHDAAHAAIDSTGGSMAHSIRSGVLRDPGLGTRGGSNSVVAPAPVFAQAPVAPNVNLGSTLNDPSLGARVTGLGPLASGGKTLVGSGSLAQAGTGGIPAAIANASANLSANTQSSTLANILNQVLHGLGGGGSGNGPSPAQEALFKAQTAQINSQMLNQQRPIDIQNQINALNAQNSNVFGVQSLALRPPGSYESSEQAQRDRQLTSLYGQQNFAKQAAS